MNYLIALLALIGFTLSMAQLTGMPLIVANQMLLVGALPLVLAWAIGKAK